MTNELKIKFKENPKMLPVLLVDTERFFYVRTQINIGQGQFGDGARMFLKTNFRKFIVDYHRQKRLQNNSVIFVIFFAFF